MEWKSNSGAKCLNFWNEKWDNESAMLFWWPGIWAALRMNWCLAKINVSLRRNCMMAGERDRPLFKISMTAVLSEWMSMDFLDHSCPQRTAAITTRYSSWSADKGKRESESRDLNSEDQWKRTISLRSHQNLWRKLRLCKVECPWVEWWSHRRNAIPRMTVNVATDAFPFCMNRPKQLYCGERGRLRI